MATSLAVRPASLPDYEKMVDYFLGGDDAFLLGMGVERSKLPKRDGWLALLKDNHEAPIEKKSFYYVIWEYEGTPIGHSNINKIIFGKEAYMHLHMWSASHRASGNGMRFVRMSIPYYFREFHLENLLCEPYANNPAPNKTLEKLGFEFLFQHDTIPGWISFHQPVNRWRLSKEAFSKHFDE